MTKCYTQLPLFASLKSRKVTVNFDGGPISSDGGGLLLRQIDKRLKLTKRIASFIGDPRRKKSTTHSLVSLLRQRIYGIALGYEDLNDHNTLRHDPAFQTVLSRDKHLAHASTLCRFENRADKQTAWLLNQALVETFIDSFKKPPQELILDFDTTDDQVHGTQEGRFFHGYYNHYCFIPLYVFCGSQLLVSYLRPSNIDPAKHALAILSLLVKRLHQEWPGVKLIIRADSGFCRWRMFSWCERHDVSYIIGLAKNTRINAIAASLIAQAHDLFTATNQKQRLFDMIEYGALSWKKERTVIVKAEHTRQGSNPRYVVTNLAGDPQYLYDQIYCARGDMENRIKEQQLDLFADRTSAHHWWPNQLRLLLSSCAYTLIEAIRRLGLVGTELKNAYCQTIRLKLFKIGASILRNTRKITFSLSSAYPYKSLFLLVAHRLARE